MQLSAAQVSATLIIIKVITSKQTTRVLNHLYGRPQKLRMAFRNRSKKLTWLLQVFHTCNKCSSRENKKTSYRLTKILRRRRCRPGQIVKWAERIILEVWARRKALCKWVELKDKLYRCLIVWKNHIRAKVVLHLQTSTTCLDTPWLRHTLCKVAPLRIPPLLVAGKIPLSISSR